MAPNAKLGANVPETHIIELGKSSGTVSFSHDTYDADRMLLIYQDQIIADTGCLATSAQPANVCSGGQCRSDQGVRIARERDGSTLLERYSLCRCLHADDSTAGPERQRLIQHRVVVLIELPPTSFCRDF